MSETHTYQHWKVETDDDQIVWAYFDKANSQVNTIDHNVLQELELICQQLAPDTKGLVLCSKKQSGFIAGADINAISALSSTDEALNFIQYGQKVFNQLEALPIPTLALIEGFCLGGGMELALACRYRICEESTLRMGLPEVLLGIQPGWGGTVRLPRLIGAFKALDMMLSGRHVNGKKAKQYGLVDEALPKRQLHTAVKYYLTSLPSPHKAKQLERLTNMSIMRSLIAHKVRKQLKAKINPAFYPAPFAMLDNWQQNGVHPFSKALQVEAQSIITLLEHNTGTNLIRVYQLRERLKALAKNIAFKPKHVHVIGAGTMGGDIAAWCALRGMTVTLQDQSAEYLSQPMKRAYALFKRKLKIPRKIQEASDRLIPDILGHGLKKADVVIEAIFEQLGPKQKLFMDIESQVKPDALLATNTSSFPIDDISQSMQQPERLVGIHFFNPVAKMPLVEVVHSSSTKKLIIDQAKAFVGKLDKLPLPVTSSPGFLVNRVLMPYLMEAMRLIDEGVPNEVIDKAALDFGMPMGPIELADTVGLDVCLQVAESLAQHFPGEISSTLKHKVSEKNMGKKTGKGFYQYKNGKKLTHQSPPSYHAPEDIAERLVFCLANEAVACMREQVVDDADLIDAGLIFGAGFAPFRGGIIHYLKQKDITEMQTLINALQQRHGERFMPDHGWGALMSSRKLGVL